MRETSAQSGAGGGDEAAKTPWAWVGHSNEQPLTIKVILVSQGGFSSFELPSVVPLPCLLLKTRILPISTPLGAEPSGAAVAPPAPSHPSHCSSWQPSTGTSIRPKGCFGVGIGLETRDLVMGAAAVPPSRVRDGMGTGTGALGEKKRDRREGFVPWGLQGFQGAGDGHLLPWVMPHMRQC